MKSVLFDHNGIQVTWSDFVIHGNSYPISEIESFRLAESKTLSSVGILFMLVGWLLLIEEDFLFVFGGLMMIVGVLMRFAHETAYSLFITVSKIEKSVFVSKDILLLNKILKALETAKAGNTQQPPNFRPPLEASLG